MRTALLFNLDDGDKRQHLEYDNHDYLNKQVIMYSGRKKSLLPNFEEEVLRIKKRLGKDKITILEKITKR